MNNLLGTIIKGGYIMIPIGICSVAALTVLIERLIRLRRSRVIPDDFLLDARRLLLKSHYEEVLTLCREASHAVARLLEVAVARRDLSRDEIREALVGAGKEQSFKLERFFTLLATVAGISPLLGLLGTVVGMIRVFHDISIVGVGNPTALSNGISEALITTAAGLMVGIPALIAYNYLQKRADILVLEMERLAMEFLEIVKHPKEKSSIEF